MTSRLEIADVTCPASQAASNPVEVPLAWQGGVLLRFTITIPDGHAGLTGIALGFGHNAVIPFTGDAYFSGNDRVLAVDWEDQNPGVQWSAFLCNLDLQAHSWEVQFELDEAPVTNTSAQAATLTAADIYAAGAVSTVSG